MKKAVAITLALILLVSLTACGGNEKNDDPNLGLYECTAVELMGISMAPEDLMSGETSLELKAGGKGTAIMDGSKASLKWELDGTALSFTFEGETFTGTLENGVIKAEMMGMTMTFVNANYKPATANGGASAIVPANSKSGYFTLESGVEDGNTLSGDELRALGLNYYVLLNEDGTAVFQLDNTMTGTWKDGVMRMSNDDGDVEDLPFTLAEDELTVDLDGLVMVFMRSNETPPSVQLPVAANEPALKKLTRLQQWWDGNWYGYWTVSSVTDGYKHLDDGRWDCYAVIDMNTDNTGTIYLWDAENAVFTLNISVSEAGGSGFMGAAISENGTYWDGAEIGRADIIIDPNLYGYDDYMIIDGYYDSASDPGEGFYYWAHLRPWGTLWDDIAKDERPPWYSWYVDNTGYDMLEAIANDEEGSGFIHPGLSGVSADATVTGSNKDDATSDDQSNGDGRPEIDIDLADGNFSWGPGEKGIDGWVTTKDGTLKLQVPEGWEKSIDLGNEEIGVRDKPQFDYSIAVRIRDYSSMLAKKNLAHTPENQAKENTDSSDKIYQEKWGNTDVWYRLDDVEGRDTTYVYGFAAYSGEQYLAFDVRVKRDSGTTLEEFMKSDAWKTLTTTFELTLP